MATKDLPGASHPCPALKSFSNKLGVMFCFHSSQNKDERLDSKLERKMIEIKRSASGQNKFKSINSIIMKFPQFREGLKEIRSVFQQFDEDCNGKIDREELNKCLQKLHLSVREEDIDDLFCASDIDENEGIQLNEFIVLVCLIYFLMDSSVSPDATSDVLSLELRATFNTIIEAFLFLDKNGDGKLHKKDVVKALNEAGPWEKLPPHVTRTRFSTIKPTIMLLIYIILDFHLEWLVLTLSQSSGQMQKNWTLTGKERLVSGNFSLLSSVGLVLTWTIRITRQRVKSKSKWCRYRKQGNNLKKVRFNERELIVYASGQ